MRQILYFFLLFGILYPKLSHAQVDSTAVADTPTTIVAKKYYPVIDSAALAKKNQVRDSLTWHFLNPDSKRANPWVEKLLTDNITTDPHLLSLPKNLKIVQDNHGRGIPLNEYPFWFLPAILIILTLFGITRLAFGKEITALFNAFFDNRALSQLNKEDHVMLSWQFVFLYIIFSLTLALLICLVMYKINASATATDFSSFLLISLAIFVFFGLKILTLKLVGFLFELQKLVKEYLNIIYLTYINALFVLLPLTFILTLSGETESRVILLVSLISCSLLFGLQLIRLSSKILFGYRLSKFYLFLYLCTFEICPIILFVKAVNISL